MSLLRGEKPKLPGEEEGVSPLCGAGEVMALEQWMAITQYEDSGTVDWIEHQDPASTWLLSFYVEVLTSEIANLYPYRVLQSLRARSTRVLSHTAPPPPRPCSQEGDRKQGIRKLFILTRRNPDQERRWNRQLSFTSQWKTKGKVSSKGTNELPHSFVKKIVNGQGGFLSLFNRSTSLFTGRVVATKVIWGERSQYCASFRSMKFHL